MNDNMAMYLMVVFANYHPLIITIKPHPYLEYHQILEQLRR